MPDVKRFADSNDLIAALRECRWSERFARARRAESACDLTDIVRHSVGRNTFRAFHHQPHRPSDTFRAWALSALDETRLRSFQQVKCQPEYSDWLYRLSDHFSGFWKKQMQGNEIPYGPALKLPNLLAKQLCLYREISDERAENLMWYLEVPLDSYTIQAVANCVDVFVSRDAIGNIPSGATMGFIKNRAMYEAFQNGIRQIANKASVPAIALDYVAWSEAH